MASTRRATELPLVYPRRFTPFVLPCWFARGSRVLVGVFEECSDTSEDHFDGDAIVAASRNDDVGNPLRRLDELQVHRAHGLFVLIENGFHRATAFLHVASNAAHEAYVVRRIDVDFDVHDLDELRFRQHE